MGGAVDDDDDAGGASRRVALLYELLRDSRDSEGAGTNGHTSTRRSRTIVPSSRRLTQTGGHRRGHWNALQVLGVDEEELQQGSQ